MSNDVKVNIDVSDGGSTAALTKLGEKLKNVLKGAADVASSIRVPMATAAATQGVNASNMPSSKPVRAGYAATSDKGASDTNLSRGLAGQTGAGGRDFAAQAQGLGGLVHVYATFAANLFAVSAAFGALSKAMDTANLVKGLDQLGASSGKALGSVAKQMVVVSDGALALRDAMTSTAMASAGGMTNSAILRMTEVAKKASLALGRDMPDSMDRLTKGIIKIQPELLDELGIMTRVLPAQAEYARQLGKSASALTDFEKRQAFANAVLTEGEKKFGEIELNANPYSKILASTQNLLQSGLELVNKFLGPLMSLLASSPTGLTLVLGGIASMLLKQAIPAIGMFRQNAKLMADEAHARVTQQVKDQQWAGVAADAAVAAKAEKAFKTESKTLTDIDKLHQQFNKKVVGTEIRDLLKKSPFDLSTEDMAKIEAKHKDLIDKVGNTEAQKQADNIKKRLDGINFINSKMKAAGEEAANANEARDTKWYTHQSQLTKNLIKLNKEAAKRDVLAGVADTAATLGPTAAWDQLKKETGKLDMGTFSKGMTIAKGGVSILTSAVGTAVSAFGFWGQAVGAAIAAFGILDSYMSSNAKQAEESAAAITRLADASATLDNVLKDLSSRDPLYRISSAAMSAKATAINEVADAADNAFKKIKAQDDMAGLWDRLIDTAKIITGSNLLKKSASELAVAVANTFKAANPGKDTAKALKEVQDLIGVDPRDQKALYEALNDTPEKFLELSPKIIESLKQLSLNLNNTASAGTSLDDSFKTAGKTFDDLITAMQPTDNLAKLGYQTIDVAMKMAKAFEDPTTALSKLVEISGDSNKLRFLSPEAMASFGKVAPEIKMMATDIATYTNRIDELKVETDALIVERDKLAKGSNAGNNQDLISGKNKEIAQKRKDTELLVSVMDPLKAKIEPYIQKLKEEQQGVFQRGAKEINVSIGEGFAKAAITLSKAYAEGLGSTIGGIQEKARLEKEGLSIQLRQIDTSSRLADTMEKLRFIEEERLILEQQTKLDTGPVTADTAKKQGELTNRRVALQIAKEYASDLSDNLHQVTADLTNKFAGRAQGAAMALPGIQSKQAAKANRAQAVAQIGAVDISKDYAIMAAEVELEKDILSVASAKLATDKTSIDIRAKYALYLDDELLLAKRNNTEASIKNKEDSDNLSIQLEINKAKVAFYAAGTGTEAETNAFNAMYELQDKQAKKEAKDKESLAQREIGYIDEKNASNSNFFKISQERAKALEDSNASISANDIAAQELKLNLLSSMGAIEAAETITRTAVLEVEKEIARTRGAQFAADQAQAAIIKDLEAKKATQVVGSTAATEIQAEITAKTSYYNIAKAGEASLSAAKQISITQTAAINTLNAVQADQMSKMLSTTESLTTVFGELGTSIGKVGEAFLNMAQTDERNLNAKKALVAEQENFNELTDASTYSKNIKAQAELEKKSSRDKLVGTAAELGAVKKLFAEHTLGYKLIDKAEKATHLIKIYNDNKELATTIFNLAKAAAMELGFIATTATAGEAADMAAATSKIPAVIMEFMKWLGPWGTVAAGAAIAAVLGGSGGGGGGSQVDMTGMTSADRQSTQGTGQSWQTDATGTKVKTDTGGGIFGDSSAKSTAIVDSLEIMRANSIEGLNYDNKMLKALEKLADSVVGAAKSLYAIPGLRAGTGFGTSAGETSSGGFGSSIPVVGKLLSSIFGGGTSSSASVTSAGLQLKGTFTQVMNDTEGSIMQYKDVLTKFHEDGGLFGSDSDWSTLNTETKKLKAEAATAISDIFKDANALFLELGTKTGKTSEAIGTALSQIDVSMPVDLMNLTGQALVDELNAVIGDKLSNAAKQIFAGFDQYKNFGEDYLATIVRVVDGNNKLDQALRSTGASFSILGKFDVSEAMIKAAGGLQSFMEQASFFKDAFLSEAEKLAPVQKGVTDQLAKLHISTSISREDFKKLVLSQDLSTKGGQELYQSLMELAPGFDTATKALEATTIKTYDLITQLLTAEGRTDEALQRTRAKVLEGMSIEDAAIQRQINLQEDTNKTRGLNITLMGLEGKTSKALTLTREQELLALSITDQAVQERIYKLQDEAKKMAIESAIYTALGDTESALVLTREAELKTVEDILKPAKLYLYALQDEATLKGKLTAAYNKESTAIKSTITSLTSSIKTLKDYKNTLTMGASSILTPGEKYAQAKAEAYQTAQIAQTTITDKSTPTEIAARDAAANKFPAAAQALLDASGIMYASGPQYASDVKSMLDLLDSTTANLTVQQTDAEKQLTALDASVSFLDVIATSTETTATLLEQYLVLQGATLNAQQVAIQAGSGAAASAMPAFANGGVASGVSLVGERGPEIVDFKNPGRVYSNRASNDLLNTKDLVAEIKALRDEVSQLRADQKEQTGHLIATNYDANNKNANTVANANETALKQQDWKVRSQVKVA